MRKRRIFCRCDIYLILRWVVTGESKVKKIINLVKRSNQLVQVAREQSIDLAFSHGSRTHMVAARRLGIPYVELIDYEYSEQRLANWLADHILMPSYIPERRVARAGFNLKKVLRYDGFKEEVYLKDFVPDPTFRQQLGVSEQVILVTIRPPSVTANYHDKRSEILFLNCLRHFASIEGTHCLVVNRTNAEKRLIPDDLLAGSKVSLLTKPVDGLQLLWQSDLVVSGGGTMNRESALLGTPTYSIFTGRRPAMDEHLQQLGKLSFLETVDQVRCLRVEKRTIGCEYTPTNIDLASRITDIILDLNRKHHPGN